MYLHSSICMNTCIYTVYIYIYRFTYEYTSSEHQTRSKVSTHLAMGQPWLLRPSLPVNTTTSTRTASPFSPYLREEAHEQGSQAARQPGSQAARQPGSKAATPGQQLQLLAGDDMFNFQDIHTSCCVDQSQRFHLRLCRPITTLSPQVIVPQRYSDGLVSGEIIIICFTVWAAVNHWDTPAV